ncbi:LysR family transcriptional regulator [Yersinia entomophaga]|uniref:LysR family transcriptional regulator n=1 Tax=Yersinia entomophaga TaxID=935293 RepID=A0ABM6BQT8_YERET|nr:MULTISPECIES: LysR family transcriptional regulator [Yersinia]ANI31799.1 LysR family transcriptional regulator [Yersinia entomophaga]OWF85969.1 LysR family transcriptional regulator [Yersinia entomophaga]
MQKLMNLDLNDLYYFTCVAEFGGFSAASRALGISKSRLSARVLTLEKNLGVLLFQRTTRQVQLTEIGQNILENCKALVAEAEVVQGVVSNSRAEVAGLVRVSCPPLAARLLLAPYLSDFLQQYPKVRVQLVTSDQRFDPISDNLDVLIRLRAASQMDEGLVSRVLGHSQRILVASPDYLAQAGALMAPEDLIKHQTLSLIDSESVQQWPLIGPDDKLENIQIQPRLMCMEWSVMLQAVCQGLGIASVPDIACQKEIASGALVRVLPQWASNPLVVHAVFPTRRGMLLSVRVFLDFLIATMPRALSADK